MFSQLRMVFLLVLSFTFLSFTQAQSVRLTGKISNNKNEPLVGVSVRISGTSAGATTDVDGYYTLTLSAGKKYTIEVSSAGYEPKTLTDVEVAASQVNELNIVLEIKAKTEENVIVSAKTQTARKETINAVITFQRNTNTVASVISAESIRRSPDRNTGEVLKRLSGVSLLDGKFIIVRGLADRYNQAVLNGVLLTSTEPDRKTFSFDLIPASMIDNIVVNKAFVPEYPGEWAGGLIQVNTKDVPAKNFLNLQVGAGFNTQTTGKAFLNDSQKGPTDWTGVDNGSRSYPEGYTTKYQFGILSAAEKAAIGKNMRNHWVANESNAPLNNSVQINAGFNSKIFGKKIGGTLGVLYNRAYKTQFIVNRRNIIDLNNNFTLEADYNDTKHIKETTAGAFGGLSIQLNPYNKISAKAIVNVNTTNAVTDRNGIDISRQDSLLKGNEFVYRQNIFFTTQLVGEHTIIAPLTFKWFGAFNILDGYVPDQRRLLYSRKNTSDPYTAVIANSLAQQSGSRIFQSLSDYVYTGGADLSYKFDWLGQKQTVKGGYMLQVKDRLYDALLFAYKLPKDNPALRLLTPDTIFAPENFGDGRANSTLFAFHAIVGNTYRYLANTILNAGFCSLIIAFLKS
ncbi:MAG: carboxypeptidase regulatory-like domain-containing protein [Chitinophagaceae bacterium]|nr:carboxypeptidase regulatory-like domain-containing protein [Chitinophagaceae bacterium]